MLAVPPKTTECIGFGDTFSRQEAAPTVATGSNTTLISLPGGTQDPRGIAVENVNGKICYSTPFAGASNGTFSANLDVPLAVGRSTAGAANNL